MSRGCPPDLRAKRDWDALPQETRDAILEARAMLQHLPWADGVTVSGEGRRIVFGKARTAHHYDLTGFMMRGYTIPQLVVCALKDLRIQPPEVI